MLKYTIYVTDKSGAEATVTGDEKAIDTIVAALKAAGAMFNTTVETYDFGYYDNRKQKEIGWPKV